MTDPIGHNTPRWTTPLLLLLAATCWSGCALELPEEEAESEPILCNASSDCPADETCEAGYCVVPSEQMEALAVQLTAPPEANLVREQFPQVEFEQGEALPDFQFSKPVQFTGVVLNKESQQPLAATVVATRIEPNIPGVAPQRFEIETQNQQDASYNFLLRIPRGLYDVAIHPGGEALPSQYLSGLPIDADTQQMVFFEPLSAHHRVTGRVVFTEARTGAVISAAGVKIQAFDQEDRAVSRVAVTEPDDPATPSVDEEGRFSLWVRPNISEFYLTLNPGDYNPTFPRVQTATWLISSDEADLGDLNLGELHLTGGRLVEGQLVSSDTGAPLSDASLIFRGDLGAGKVTQTVLTGPDGSFSHRLQPGVYALLIVPTDTEHAVTLRTGLTMPDLDEEVPAEFTRVEVGRKIKASGRLYSPQGDQIVSRAKVTFTPHAYTAFSGGSTEGESPFRSFVDGRSSVTVLTDSGGNFDAPLDPGEYTIIAEPPSTSGFGLTVTHRVPIETDTRGIDLYAGRSNVAYGRVLDPNGEPLPEVQVEFFRVNSQGTTPIGVGQTDANGEYRILLPEIAP